MTINDIILILIFLTLSLFTNLIILILQNKKIFIKELLVFLFFYLICLLNLNNLSIFKALFVLIVFLSFLGVYTFTTIMPFEGSPSLILLSIILKEPRCDKVKLLKKFKKIKFFKKRLKYLLQEKYIVKKNNILYLQNKKNFFLKCALFIESFHKLKNNG